MTRLIRHAMCAMMPRTSTLPGVADTDLDGFLRRMRVDSDWMYWAGVVLGACLFAVTPLLTVGIPLPSFLLTQKLLERHANRLLAHPLYLLRLSVWVVLQAAGMCWAADPRVRAHFSLAPFPVDPGTFRTS